MLKVYVWPCNGPAPNGWELPLSASLTTVVALSAISVCALRMSSMFQYVTGGASGARGGSLGELKPKGITSFLLSWALALGIIERSSKWPLRMGCGEDFEA